jgi:hypothetical protein
MEALRFYSDRTHITGRIVGAQPGLDSMLHHRTQGLAQSIGTVRLLGTSRHQLENVRTL